MNRLIQILVMVLLPVLAEAKRGPKPAEKQVRFGDVEFTSSTSKCGIVRIRRVGDSSAVEEMRIYRVRYQLLKERDVQDVWIADMFISRDTLWIRDELNRVYAMGMKDFKVTSRPDVSLKEFGAIKQR